LKTKKHILFKTFGRSITNRSAVRSLFDKDDGSSNLILDFKEVLFISRSAAHELLVQSRKFEHFEFVAVQDTVQAMFDSVKYSIENPKRKTFPLPRVKFNDLNAFEKYLNAQ